MMKNTMVLKYFDLEEAHGRRGASALLVCGVLVLATFVAFTMMLLAGFQVINADLPFWQGAFVFTSLPLMLAYTVFEVEKMDHRASSRQSGAS